MTVTPPTLLLLLVAGWPQSLWTLHECLNFRGPLMNLDSLQRSTPIGTLAAERQVQQHKIIALFPLFAALQCNVKVLSRLALTIITIPKQQQKSPNTWWPFSVPAGELAQIHVASITNRMIRQAMSRRDVPAFTMMHVLQTSSELSRFSSTFCPLLSTSCPSAFNADMSIVSMKLYESPAAEANQTANISSSITTITTQQ